MTYFFQDCDILLFLHELYFIRVFDDSTFLLEISSQQSESGIDHNGILVENNVQKDTNQVLITLDTHVKGFVLIGYSHPFDYLFVTWVCDFLILWCNVIVQDVLKIEQFGSACSRAKHKFAVWFCIFSKEFCQSNVVLDIHYIMENLNDLLFYGKDISILSAVLISGSLISFKLRIFWQFTSYSFDFLIFFHLF